MSEEKKAYRVTDVAGFWVAGKKVAVELDPKTGVVIPKVGHEMMLTPTEAEHDLRQGALEEVAPPAPKRTVKDG